MTKGLTKHLERSNDEKNQHQTKKTVLLTDGSMDESTDIAGNRVACISLNILKNIEFSASQISSINLTQGKIINQPKKEIAKCHVFIISFI